MNFQTPGLSKTVFLWNLKYRVSSGPFLIVVALPAIPD
jgi:hypothetical protein